MMNSKSSGFTLIEVLLAGALIGVVLGPVYFLQGTVYDNVLRMAQRIERFFCAYDFFLDAQQEGDDVHEMIKKPQTDLVYEVSEPSKSSPLSKNFNNLLVEKVSWHWTLQRRGYEDSFIAIRFEPPEQKVAEGTSEKAGKQEEPVKPTTPKVETGKKGGKV